MSSKEGKSADATCSSYYYVPITSVALRTGNGVATNGKSHSNGTSNGYSKVPTTDSITSNGSSNDLLCQEEVDPCPVSTVLCVSGYCVCEWVLCVLVCVRDGERRERKSWCTCMCMWLSWTSSFSSCSLLLKCYSIKCHLLYQWHPFCTWNSFSVLNVCVEKC